MNMKQSLNKIFRNLKEVNKKNITIERKIKRLQYEELKKANWKIMAENKKLQDETCTQHGKMTIRSRDKIKQYTNKRLRRNFS